MTIDARTNVLQSIEENKIGFTQLWFTDLLGNLKSVEIPSSELPRALEDGIGFDGSSVHGFARIDESDMLLHPDLETFAVFPWNGVGRLICDIRHPNGKPYEGDPRYVLKRALERAEQLGYGLQVGTELEYFYFDSGKEPRAVDAAGYFDLSPPDEGVEVRRKTVETMINMGISVEAAHHEVAPGQEEIDLRHRPALETADTLMTCRYLIKDVARQNGIYATFMPKPLHAQNGSGMHTHMSLTNHEKRNAFFSYDEPFHLSRIARLYLAGLMTHAKEIIGVCAQWVNSYKRLVPGYEAPVYITWACKNRSNMIRIPSYQTGHEGATRIEFRAPDSACNPYLAFAVMLHAGLDGIEMDYRGVDPIELDVYSLTPEERADLSIEMLPGSLNEAIACMRSSELVKRALGDHIFAKFIENKRIEWNAYRSQVHQYEIDRYLPIL